MKKAAVFSSFCSFGRAGIANMIPVFNTLGIECSAVPTAVLSTHLAYSGAVITDMTDQMESTIRHWKKLNLSFDAVVCGYLLQEKQAEIFAQYGKELLNPTGLLVVDPVMGDNGRVYRSVTAGLISTMRNLCEQASVLTPNLTEAAMILGKPLENLEADEKVVDEWAAELSDGKRCVLLTGYETDGKIGTYLKMPNGRSEVILSEKSEQKAHGLGDIYSAVLTAELLNGKTIQESIQKAENFCSELVFTLKNDGTPEPEGVPFEKHLKDLV